MKDKTKQVRDLSEIPFAFDPAKWDGNDADGKRFWLVRCRVPFTYDCPAPFARVDVVATGTEATRAIDGVGAGEAVEPDDKPMSPNVDAPSRSFIIIQGIASSTSVDWYGTEMALSALNKMAEQFRAGVIYAPTHWDTEWMDIMGESIEAAVERVDRVENAATDLETPYVLKVRVKLYAANELVQQLAARLDRREKIGQSIGGWFTVVRVISDDEGNIERVIVEDVELDHLAVTRKPANPDSWLVALRSKVEAAIDNSSLRCPWISVSASASAHATSESRSVPQSSSPAVPLEARHVVDVIDEGATVLVRFAKEVEEPDTDEVRVVDVQSDVEQTLSGDNSVVGEMAEDRATGSNAESAGDTMTPEQFEAFMASMSKLGQSVDTLNERVMALSSPAPEAQRAAVSPTVVSAPAESDEVVALRAQLAVAQQREQTLTQVLDRVAREPARRGVRATQLPEGSQRKSALGALVQRAKEQGCEAVAAVLNEDTIAAATDNKSDRSVLEANLFAVLNAALADGLISPPDERASAWQ
jgi:hypothetical protein